MLRIGISAGRSVRDPARAVMHPCWRSARPSAHYYYCILFALSEYASNGLSDISMAQLRQLRLQQRTVCERFIRICTDFAFTEAVSITSSRTLSR
eukprot:6213306-Pleurochrysis_carterae.AAC.1